MKYSTVAELLESEPNVSVREAIRRVYSIVDNEWAYDRLCAEIGEHFLYPWEVQASAAEVLEAVRKAGI